MRKKLVPLIAIAFVVAVFSTAIFYSLFAGRLNGAPAATLAPHTTIIVASRDIAAGSVLTSHDLSSVAWVGGAVPKGSYTAADLAVGKTAFTAFQQGEPILESRLASRDGAGSGIPEGMRAVSVHVSDSSGVVAMLKPGFKVDVQEFASRAARGPKEEVRTLLRGVTVLASSPQAEQSSQGYFNAPVVTLLVSAREAEELAQADSYARLRLALRNPLEKPAGTPERVAGPAATATAAPVKSVPIVRFRVRAVALTDEGLAALANRVDPRLRADGINVVVAGAAEVVNELVRSGELARAGTESVVAAPVRQWSAVDVARDGAGKIRLMLAPAEGPGRLRIRPEVTGAWGGRIETRTLETEAEPGRVIVISGVDPGESSHIDAKFRHMVVVVMPGSMS